MKIPKRRKISSVLWSKIFASQNSGYTKEFYYGVGKGGPVNHLEFYRVENFKCNRTDYPAFIFDNRLFGHLPVF